MCPRNSFDAQEAAKHYMVGSNQGGYGEVDKKRRAKATAEARIIRMENNAIDIFKEAKNIADDERRYRKCEFGWEVLGMSIHTLQDKHAHTDKNYMPLSSAEHGGTLALKGDSYSSRWSTQLVRAFRDFRAFNVDRYNLAEEATVKPLQRALKAAAGPKGCNCIRKDSIS